MQPQLADWITQTLPPIFKRLFGQLPLRFYRPLLEVVFKTTFSEAIEEGELDFLEDKTLQISVIDLGLEFVLTLVDDTIQVLEPSNNSDVYFSGQSPELVLIAARQQDPDMLFFQRKLQISGDTELGLCVKNFIDGFEWQDMPNYAQFCLAQLAKIAGARSAN